MLHEYRAQWEEERAFSRLRHQQSLVLRLNFDSTGVDSQRQRKAKTNQSIYPPKSTVYIISGDQNLKLDGKYLDREITCLSSLNMDSNFSVVELVKFQFEGNGR